jgi:hypothetical protein
MDRRRCSKPLFAWREALTDPDLGPATRFGVSRATQLSVAIAGLSLHMTIDGDKCFPSVERLSRETGHDRRTVQRALRCLTVDGWLAVYEGGGRGHSNRYYLRIPARVKLALAAPPEKLTELGLPVVVEGRHLCPDCGERFFSEEERDGHYEACEPSNVPDSPFADRATKKGGEAPLFSRERAAGHPERAAGDPLKGGETPPEVLSRTQEVSTPARVVSLDEFRRRRVASADVAVVTASDPPEWVWVWWWSRERGDTREFPQLGSAVSPMTDDAYAQLEAEWRLAGSPQEINPRWLVATTNLRLPDDKRRGTHGT